MENNEHRPDSSPNWYPDPTNGDQLRYWNGTEWTTHTHPLLPQDLGSPSYNEYDLVYGERTQSKSAAGFIRNLLDLSFAPHKLVTPSCARLIYVAVSLLVILMWLGVSAYTVLDAIEYRDSAELTLGLLALSVGWVVPLLFVAATRVVLESAIARVRASQQATPLVNHESHGV